MSAASIPGRQRTPSPQLADRKVDAAVRELERRTDEIARAPLTAAKVIRDVLLADGVATPIAHALGRAVTWMCPSAPRGPASAGMIEEVRPATLDRAQYVTLKASGWGADITVDVLVL
ncbi:MAG: hypothetical protein KBD62_37265 [Kofleriaceae bacterium]|jgi:hypothetical protein|nr:hypothetical protein [Kofleriaceae bacterium]